MASPSDQSSEAQRWLAFAEERFAESAQNIVAHAREDIGIRAQRGRPEVLHDVLAKVPDVPPVPGDELR